MDELAKHNQVQYCTSFKE